MDKMALYFFILFNIYHKLYLYNKSSNQNYYQTYRRDKDEEKKHFIGIISFSSFFAFFC